MMSNWKNFTLSEFVERGEVELTTGPFGTQLKASEYVKSGTPVINVRNIGFGEVREENIEHLSESTVKRLSKHLLRKGDIVFGRKGAVERHAYIKDGQSSWFQGSDCLRLRIQTQSLCPRFLSYSFLTSSHMQWMINQCSHGATMSSLNQDILKRIPLNLPPFPTQRRIASILSAYDDLIENNTRRIKILEEMAQRIYQEWFVHFRFPGHEKVKMVESDLGMIPIGWEIGTIADVCDSISYGYTAKATTEPVGPKFLRITDIVPQVIDWDSVPFCPIDERNISKYELSSGDIVVARTGATTGYAKRINKRHPPSVYASYLVKVRTNDRISSFYLGTMMESEAYKTYIKSIVGGAAQPNANAKMLTSMHIAVPPKYLVESFDDIIEPLCDHSELLQIKNRNLRQTRDLLLPKLISGEIDVSEMPEPKEVAA